MKRKGIIFFKLILLLILLVVVGLVFDYILVDDVQDNFRSKMNNFYHQDNIDTLFLGSSQVFCGVNTDILEEKWGEAVYLAATSVQKPDVSYYLLKEALKNYEIKTVFLDMYFWQYRDNPKERMAEQLKYIYCVSDYMNWSWDKIEFILNACPTESLIRAFVPAVRYSDQIFDLEYLDKVIKSKHSEEYLNPQIDKSDKGYRGGDISGEYTKLKSGDILGVKEQQDRPDISNPPISEYSLKYLNRIIELCKEQDVELILFATPMTEYRIRSLGNYDSFHNYVDNIAQENNIPFFDFNLYDPRYSEFTDEMHSDDHHLNALGAYSFSDTLGEMILSYENGEDVSSQFCDSVIEKQSNERHRLYGVLLEKDGDTYSIIPIHNASKESEAMNTYKVYVAPQSEDNSEKKESYSVEVENSSFVADEEGLFIIELETVDFNGNTHTASVYQDGRVE